MDVDPVHRKQITTPADTPADENERILETYRQHEDEGLEERFSQDVRSDEPATADETVRIEPVSATETTPTDVAQAAVASSETKVLDAAGRERVEEHMWLARHIARRFLGKGVPTEDILQVANEALVAASGRFDPDNGAKFSTFATSTIQGALRRHFRDKTWDVRVPRAINGKLTGVNNAADELRHKLGRDPIPEEIAAWTGLDESLVREVQHAGGTAYTATSLDVMPAGLDKDTASIAENIADPSVIDLEEVNFVMNALSALDPQARKVVFLRFWEGKMQDEIAEEVGITQTHVSRVLRAAFEKLRPLLADETEETDS